MLLTASKPFALVTKQSLEPRKPKILLRATVEQVDSLLSTLNHDTYAIDFETTGLDLYEPTTQVVGTAIAGPEGCYWISHCNGADPRTYLTLLRWMRTKKLVAFNVAFDGKAVLRDTGEWYQWVMCVYGMFRQLTQDRDPEFFHWNLDTLETDVLGWPESHKHRMRELLSEHSLAKSDMYRLAYLEPEEFGHYAALDAEAAWQGYQYFRSVIVANYKEWGKTLAQYHTQDFLTFCHMLAEQNIRGMYIDRAALSSYKHDSEERVAVLRKELFADPSIKSWITDQCEKAAAGLIGPEPPKFKKGTTETTKRWENWKAKLGTTVPPEQAVNWNSKHQLQDLFFRYLKFTPTKFSEKTQQPAVDKFVLKTLGPIGNKLLEHNRLVKNLGYVNGLWALSAGGIFHSDTNSHGTLTGRPAAGQGES